MYMESCFRERANPSKLFECPGTLLDHIAVDSMHAADLGVFGDALGSLFFVEISCKLWYRKRDDGLAQLNRDLEEFYAANPGLTKVTPLAMTQIIAKTPGFPFLKAKAAAARHLADFALALATKHKHGLGRQPYKFRAGSRLGNFSGVHTDHLVAMCKGMADYHRLCSETPFDRDACKASIYLFLTSLRALHDLWRWNLPVHLHAKLPFHIRRKAHLMHHLAEDKLQMWGSPSRFWCYRDEECLSRADRRSGERGKEREREN
jgi:hypothetical protein